MLLVSGRFLFKQQEKRGGWLKLVFDGWFVGWLAGLSLYLS